MSLLLEAAGLVLVGLGFLLAWRSYPSLPEQVPLHFNFRGTPDRWGPRRTIWLLPVVSLCVYALLSGLMLLRLPPGGALFHAVVTLEVLALFLTIEKEQVDVAMGRRDRLGGTVWVLLAVNLLTVFLLPWLQSQGHAFR
jgi:uncharacterized membrane protein